MSGIAFLGISVLAFIGLYFYTKKSDSPINVNRKELMNELYDKNKQSKKVDVEAQSEKSLELLDKEQNNVNTLETEEIEEEEENEKFSYDSYMSDEEYLKVAKLAKNIYYSIVAIVIFLLAILYVVMFKI